MADEIEYEVKVDTSEVKQAENAFTRFTNKASQAFSGLGGKLKDVGDKFGELPGVVGNASTSLMGLGRSMLALVANPIGAVIAALVGIFVALKESLSKTEDGMDAVARVTGAFSALVKPLVETVSSLAVVLVDGLGAALEMVSSLFGGAADEGRKLADLNDQLEDQEIALAELRANQNKQLAQARELLSDSNAALGDRKKALDQVRKSETDLASKELKFAQDRLKAAKLDQQLNGATEASKKAISEATIGVANAETELAAKRRLFNREEKKEIYIPEFSEFLTYAIEKEPLINQVDLKLKYESWVVNEWRDGNGNKISNWKSKLLNTLPYIKKVTNGSTQIWEGC